MYFLLYRLSLSFDLSFSLIGVKVAAVLLFSLLIFAPNKKEPGTFLFDLQLNKDTLL